jgi:hypothetical protein
MIIRRAASDPRRDATPNHKNAVHLAKTVKKIAGLRKSPSSTVVMILFFILWPNV